MPDDLAEDKKAWRTEVLIVGLLIGVFLLLFIFTEKPYERITVSAEECPDALFRSIYIVIIFCVTYPFVFLCGVFFLYGASEKSETWLTISLVCIALHYSFLFIKFSGRILIENKNIINRTFVIAIEGFLNLLSSLKNEISNLSQGEIIIGLLLLILTLQVYIIFGRGSE